MNAQLPMPAMPSMSPVPSMSVPSISVPSMAVPRRSTLAERLARRIGLGLVAWSNRPRRAARLTREYNPHEHRERAAARAAREEHWARAMYYRHPWR